MEKTIITSETFFKPQTSSDSSSCLVYRIQGLGSVSGMCNVPLAFDSRWLLPQN